MPIFFRPRCLPAALLAVWTACLLPAAAQTPPAPAAPRAEPVADTSGAPSPAAQKSAPNPSLASIPPAPASHILDESGMLDSETFRNLSARLLSCQTRTGLALYLSIQTYLTDENANSRANRTHGAWIEGQGAGIVVVHDRSTTQLSFAGSDDTRRMPDADGLRALYRLADAAAKRLPPEATGVDRLVATMQSLADGLESWQKNGRLPAPPEAAPAAASAAEPVLIHTRPPWPQPAGFIVDEAGVFRDPAAAAALDQQLTAWHRKTGLRLYLVSVTYPPSGLALPLADKLALEWLAGGMGGVIVYDRSQPDTLTFGGSTHPDLWLSPVQLKQLHTNALAKGLAAGDKPDAWLPAAAAELQAGYERDGLPLLLEGQRWLPQNKKRILPWVLGGFVLCAGFLYLFQRWQERADRRRRTVFLFPEVYVPERLGAPHGGGITAETAPMVSATPTPMEAAVR